MSCPGGLQGLLEVIGDPHFHNFSFSASARTAVSAAANCAALRPGTPKIAMRESRGTISLSSPICFPLNSGRSRNIPVILPPGRAKLLTYPFATGSLSKSMATMEVVVAFLAAAPASGVVAEMAFTLSRTRSPAGSGALTLVSSW